MTTPRGPMALALLYGAAGSHPASWLHPDAPGAAPTDLRPYLQAAQAAERGMFDLFFIADTPAARTENLRAWSRFPMFMNVLEPVTLLTALAGVTSRIGLGGTVSTSAWVFASVTVMLPSSWSCISRSACCTAAAFGVVPTW